MTHASHATMKGWERQALREGWTTRTTGKGHIMWRGPKGQVVVTSKTPDTQLSLNRARIDLRKAGLDI